MSTARSFFGFSANENIDLITLNSRMFNARREHKHDQEKLAQAEAFYAELKGEITGEKQTADAKPAAPEEKAVKGLDVVYSGVIRALTTVAGKVEKGKCTPAEYREALFRVQEFFDAHPSRVNKDQVCRILLPTGKFLREQAPETVEVVNALFEKMGRTERLLTDAEEDQFVKAAKPLADLARYRDRSVIPDSLNTVVKLGTLLTGFLRYVRREQRVATAKKAEVAELLSHFGTSSLVGGLYVGEMGYVNRCVQQINDILQAVGSEQRYEELDPSDYVGKHRLDEPVG